MEQDLNKYIVNEFCKLQTDTEQRSFIENFRFLMMSNDINFENYDSNKALRRTDFYSIADMLYQLNNFWMLSTFNCNHLFRICQFKCGTAGFC